LVAFIGKPKAGFGYWATAAHFAAEPSTSSNVKACTTDDLTESVDAWGYDIDPDNEEGKIAYLKKRRDEAAWASNCMNSPGGYSVACCTCWATSLPAPSPSA
jgi:hypothetical protein